MSTKFATNRLRADLLLLLTAFIWGTTFVAQKNANDSMGPISFVGARFLLAAMVLVPLVFYETKKQVTPLNHGDLALAGAIGLCLFLGSVLQQIGLLSTSVSNAGFLTALYVVFVPFVVWLLRRERPRLSIVLACVISIVGAWLLTDNGQARTWNSGDPIVLVADIAWATSITLVPIYLSRTARPFFLSFAQYGITAVLGLAAGAIREPATVRGLMAAVPAILYAGLLSGGVAYTLQIIAQKHTPASEASLIMSLESVFAAVAGAILLHEHLTLSAMVGCALILFGVVIVEIAPVVSRYTDRHDKGSHSSKSTTREWRDRPWV